MDLEKKIVENFWKLNLVKLPSDIFYLDYKKIERLEGWGKQSVSNLKYSIDKKKQISFERFIYSLGIRHIGLENAKILSRYFKTIINFTTFIQNKRFDELLDIDGIGEIQINSIKQFFENKTNLDLVFQLKKILLILDFKEHNKIGILKNKTFMITGKLNGISRAELKSLIEQNSGTIISSVSKKLNFLIVGEKPTKRKIDSANGLKIKILNQNDLLNMLKVTS